MHIAQLFESKCSVAQTWHLKGDPNRYRQPVKIAQEIDDMVISCPDIVDNACQFVLHKLQLIEQFLHSTLQQGVAVIHPGGDDAVRN